MKYITALFAVLALALVTTPARAQDPVKVDPKHYKVEFENDQVRVLRIHYGVGEKSVMHSHPDNVAVFLVDQTAKFTYPDGKSEEETAKAGQTMWGKAGAHLPENVGKGPIDLILVELKGKPAEKKESF
jgi:mannose-6-phosphate isomerase-like protein (cupin superfamily)